MKVKEDNNLMRDLWFAVLDSQMETGTPYLLYKDACNKKSNQKNINALLNHLIYARKLLNIVILMKLLYVI